MAQHPDQEPTSIVFYGEGIYTPEVKAIRDTLVDTVDDFLAEIAAKHTPVGGVDPQTQTGFVLRHADVITATDFGLDKQGLGHLAEEAAQGMSLTGDGQTTPYRLQAGLPVEWIDGVPGAKLITVHGSDPLERALHGKHHYDAFRHAKVIVSFQVEDIHGGIREYSGYRVSGSGLLLRNYLSGSGVHGAGQLVRDVPGAEAALTELQDAVTTVRQQLG